MVAGDLVNTASRIQSAAEPGSRARRRDDAARDRGRDRLRGRRRARAEGQSRARPALARVARVALRRRRRSGRPGSSRPSSAATASCASSRSSSTPPRRTAGRTSSRSSASAASASRGWRGSSRSTSTGSPSGICWHCGPLPRLRRRCRLLGAGRDGARCAPGSSRTRTPDSRPAKLARRRRGARSRPRGAPLRRAAARAPARTRGGRRRRPARTSSPPRACSSSGWPSTGPTVLVFEDIHWADSALLDFIEYLLEWSRDVPLFVLTLARPELTDRRPTWGAGKRNFTSIFLEPLSPDAMEALLDGPVPGLPDELRDRILERAEGVPLLRRRDRAHAARPRSARPRGQRLPADRRRSRRSRSRRRCRRSSPPGSTA